MTTELGRADTAPDQGVNHTLVPTVEPVEPVAEPATPAEADHVPVRVDPTAADDERHPWQREPARRPVVQPWLLDAGQRRQAAAWALAEWTHPIRFHGVRVPVYALRLASTSPRGAARVTGRLARWVSDSESRGLIATAAGSGDVKVIPAYSTLAAIHSGRIKARGTAAGVGAASLAAAEAVLWNVGPSVDAPIFPVDVPVYLSLTNTAGLLALGWVGRLRERPIVSNRLTTSGAAPRLTSEIVVRALGAAGITGMTPKNAETVQFVGVGIGRDAGGWLAQVDLPDGVTVSAVLEKRDRLAVGLRRPLGAVWPESVPGEHPGRMHLFVADRDLSKTKPPPWALVSAGTVDYFAPESVPWGTDPRGRWVNVGLFENNVLIGAIPGAGKTATLRPLILAVALDPLAEQWVYNLKGNKDLKCAEKFAARYFSHAGDKGVYAALCGLRDLKAEILRRTEVMASLPEEAAPDGSVTRELAARRHLGLHPLVVTIDECQQLFAHKEHGEEAGELAAECIKLARAFGITLILATQRPDANSLPTGVSANVSIRFCLRVMGQTENDMILGTSMYKNGIRATTFRASDKGIGLLVGGGDEPLVVRVTYLDIPTSNRIADRARALRIADGTLTGYAAGEWDAPADTGPDFNLLADVLQAMGGEQEHLAVIAVRLAEAGPRYQAAGGDPWSVQHLGAQLRAAGVDVGQTWATDLDGRKTNATGTTREAVRDAIADDVAPRAGKSRSRAGSRDRHGS